MDLSVVAYVWVTGNIRSTTSYRKPRGRTTVPKHRQVRQPSSSRRQTSRLAGLHGRWNSTALSVSNECRTLVNRCYRTLVPNSHYCDDVVWGACCLASTVSLLRSRIVLLVIRAFSLFIDLRRRSRSIDTAYREIFSLGWWRLLERSIRTSLVRIPCVLVYKSITPESIRLFCITVFVSWLLML